MGKWQVRHKRKYCKNLSFLVRLTDGSKVKAMHGSSVSEAPSPGHPCGPAGEDPMEDTSSAPPEYQFRSSFPLQHPEAQQGMAQQLSPRTQKAS